MLRLPTVADKTFLVTIGDRSVGGMCARDQMVAEILCELFGLGPLEPLLADPTISDILINGSRVVYVERYGRLEHSGNLRGNFATLRKSAQRGRGF